MNKHPRESVCALPFFVSSCFNSGQYGLNTVAVVIWTHVRYLIPLAAVGLCVAANNYIWFDNVFEFGHNDLEEFTDRPQFPLTYVPRNICEKTQAAGYMRTQLLADAAGIIPYR